MKLRTKLMSLVFALPLLSPLAALADYPGGYYLRVYNTNGTKEPAWSTSKDSFGINQTTATGWVCMTNGSDWGRTGAGSPLPKKISAIAGSANTWFYQTSASKKYDACYDIWFDNSWAPNNRNSAYELMLWLQWAGTKPIATSYDASGNAVPYARNVSLGGYSWNVYYRRGTQSTFSFLLTTQRSGISTQIKPFWQYAIGRGWMGSGVYLNSVMAGWENLGGGKYTATSFGVSGL